MVAHTKPGTSVKITLLREGERKVVTIILEERSKEGKEAGPGEEPPQESAGTKIGLIVQTLTPDIARQPVSLSNIKFSHIIFT